MVATKTTDKSQVESRAGCRLEKIHRLPDSAAYSRVFRDASRSRDRLFIVLSRSNGTEHARLGLAISKKHCRLASARNRLKRIVRESFRQQQDALGGLDIVVLAQSGADRVDNRVLFDSLTKHWQKTRSAAARASETGSKAPLNG